MLRHGQPYLSKFSAGDDDDGATTTSTTCCLDQISRERQSAQGTPPTTSTRSPKQQRTNEWRTDSQDEGHYANLIIMCQIHYVLSGF